jgi:hypothetical protein
MRPFTRPLLFAAALVAAFLAFASPRAALADVTVSIAVFHDELAPHGRWVTAGSYGTCWAPNGVVAGWGPYVDGEWVWTDYGWTWVSNDPWTDVVYHYGTWAWVDPYGWVWVPGTVWAPAWVTWAYTDDYVGWAPVPPSLTVSAAGYVGPPVVVSAARYVFVPTARFAGVPVATARVPAGQAATILARSTRVTRFPVSGGIVHTAGLPPERIEKAIGHPMPRGSVDRLRAQPTAMTAGGHGKGRIAVVSPAPERARMVAAAPREVKGNAARVENHQVENHKVVERNAGPKVERANASSNAVEHKTTNPNHGAAVHVEQKKTSHASHPVEPVHQPQRVDTGHEKGGPPPHEKGGSPPPPPPRVAAAAPEHAVRENPQPAPGNHEVQHGNPHAAPPGQVQAKPKGPPAGPDQVKDKDKKDR